MVLVSTPAATPEDREVLAAIGALHEQLAVYVREPRRWTGLVAKVLLARAIQGSNSIEGYTVSLDDAVAALDEDEAEDADPTSWAAVRAYRDAMRYVLQLPTTITSCSLPS